MQTMSKLSALTLQVLLHVARYHMTEVEVLRYVFPQHCPTRRATDRLLTRLVDDRLLGSTALFRRRQYFYLAEAGIKELGGAGQEVLSSHDRTGPLSEFAKIRSYAFLAFCCLSKQRRERLTVGELRAWFPEFHRPGLPNNYYLDRSASKPRLGFLRIDTGGHSRWDRVLERCRSDLREHAGHPVLCRLIEAEQFELAIVTALPEKAERIRLALVEDPNARRMRVCITAIPDLIYLIAPPPSRR